MFEPSDRPLRAPSCARSRDSIHDDSTHDEPAQDEPARDGEPEFDPFDEGPPFDAEDYAEALLDAPDSCRDPVDMGLPTRELLGALLAIPPCLPVLGALLGVNRSGLAPDEAITFVQVLQRQVAALAAVCAEATLAAASGHPVTEELQVLGDAALNSMLDRHEYHGGLWETAEERTIRIHDAAREEYATALRISQQEAHSRFETARLLVGPLTRTLDALARGEITPRHADVMAQAAARLPGAAAITSMVLSDAERIELAPLLAEACQSLQDGVLPTARRATVSITRQRANRAVLGIDAEGQERRRRQARCTRDVWVTPEQDGHCLLMARMGTAQALACLTAIDAAATDPRLESDGAVDCTATIGERRTEALARVLLAVAGMPSLAVAPTPSRSRPRERVRVDVDVTIPLDSLLGLSDAPGQLAAGCGRGPWVDASADEIRGLLADPDVDATLRRLVVDPQTGHLLDVGRIRYQVPARLREFVTRRDRTCRFPGCQRRATLCEIDHAVAWNDNGETTRANLGALCIRHHQLKTHAGWQLTAPAEDGSCSWTSPHGRRYDTPARPVLDAPDPIDADPDPPPF